MTTIATVLYQPPDNSALLRPRYGGGPPYASRVRRMDDGPQAWRVGDGPREALLLAHNGHLVLPGMDLARRYLLGAFADVLGPVAPGSGATSAAHDCGSDGAQWPVLVLNTSSIGGGTSPMSFLDRPDLAGTARYGTEHVAGLDSPPSTLFDDLTHPWALAVALAHHRGGRVVLCDGSGIEVTP